MLRFLGVLPDFLSQGVSLQPIKWYKMPGGKEVLWTKSMSPHEEPTPTKPLVRAPSAHSSMPAD